MKQSSNLIFFGTEDFSATSLEALIADGWHIAAVVTKPDSPRGRKQVVTAPKVKEIALKNNIEVLQPQKISEIADKIKGLQPRAGVLVSYGKIIPRSIIDLFPMGITNVHPSLLPKYRGPSPIESAIANGDKETGISIMSLTAKMDAGPVFTQKTVPLEGTETRPFLYDKLARLGAQLLIKVLPQILDGSLKATPQDEKAATYCQLLTKNDDAFDNETLPAEAIERKVRAYLDFPKSKLTLFGHEVIITKTRVVHEPSDGPLVIECGDNTYLELVELIAPSGRTMSSSDFLRGYKKD